MALRPLGIFRNHLSRQVGGALHVAPAQKPRGQLLARPREVRIDLQDLLEQVRGARRLSGLIQQYRKLVLALPVLTNSAYGFLQQPARLRILSFRHENLRQRGIGRPQVG